MVAPFFGHPAMTMTLISRLAHRHESPVLFCCAVYDADIGRHRLHHFEGEAAIGDASPEVAVAALNRDVERCAPLSPSTTSGPTDDSWCRAVAPARTRNLNLRQCRCRGG